jgi:hypothetical protein
VISGTRPSRLARDVKAEAEAALALLEQGLGGFATG